MSAGVGNLANVRLGATGPLGSPSALDRVEAITAANQAQDEGFAPFCGVKLPAH